MRSLSVRPGFTLALYPDPGWLLLQYPGQWATGTRHFPPRADK